MGVEVDSGHGCFPILFPVPLQGRTFQPEKTNQQEVRTRAITGNRS